MNALLRQRAFESLAESFCMRAPELVGHATAYGAVARLPERGADVILRLARRHAGNKKFNELCQAI
jgi:hypothetical protein